MIRIDVEIEHWINGAARFRTDWARLAREKVDPVMKRGFQIADERVHVITGQLKSSGRYEVEQDGDEVRGELIYDAPYAVYEFGRGGEHDAMTPAIVEIADEFATQMMKAAEDVVQRWR